MFGTFRLLFILLFIDIPSFIQTSFIIQISYHVSSSYCQQTFAHFTIKLWHVPDENQHQMLIYMPTGIPTKRSLLYTMQGWWSVVQQS